ncbi:MAG TPA: AAA family ATPase, partial [Casimicrobium sp.]|nr:AAA family ATPase [Casimicrobium sp.]
MDPWGWGRELPKGVTVILSAEAGAGKSTFLAKSLSSVKGRVLYVSSEESAYRLGERVMRIGADPELAIYHQKSIFEILKVAEEERPDILVIDSLNACHGIDSHGQNVALNDRLDLINQAVIRQKMTAILISHVNGDGEIFGPTTLEHMSDILMTMKVVRGGPADEVRVIEGKKNRFGPTGRYGAFRHVENGLTRTE